MGLGNLFKSLFGSSDGGKSSKTAADPVEYKGFSIVAEPIHEGGQYRTAGKICKEVDGVMQEVRFIRADNNGDLDSSIEHCLYKGKQIIDEQGEAILSREMV